jgi:NADH-quinone oxidoreductase subunit G
MGMLSTGANSAGLTLAGVLPGQDGAHAGSMLGGPLDCLLTLGIEPDKDIAATDDAVSSMSKAGFVFSLTAFDSEALRETSDLLLPVGTWAETSGTFVNVEGRWQSFAGVANPVGQARPAWKVLRVLGNLLDAEGFEYITSEEVRDEFAATISDDKPEAATPQAGKAAVNGADDPASDIDVPIYSVDALVRRANALQMTVAARAASGDDG